MNIPRNEYPRPQMVREEWMNLNGRWEFEIDNSKCGLEKEFYNREKLNGEILVPFCPESSLSGIANKDFMNAVWYRRDVEIPEHWNGKRILLHFGAVDHAANVYINGTLVGEHQGGYTPFTVEITKQLKPGKNSITVYAEDEVSRREYPAGKQSQRLSSYGCVYTRTTGIWQTVWMEPVEAVSVSNIKYKTSVSENRLFADIRLDGCWEGAQVEIEAAYQGKPMGAASAKALSGTVALTVGLAEAHLWEPGCGRLYDVTVRVLQNGETMDCVTGYFGLREVGLNQGAFVVNGKPVFGRWVLDQGFYPDGIYTAPSDEALKADIEYSMQLGFNGARLHEKVFEPRFLYWADSLGYMVWGEFPDWGMDRTRMAESAAILPQWMEAVERDFSHPALIGWCPLNEVWPSAKGTVPCNDLIHQVYAVTKAMDDTRPVIDASGGFHVETDIYDIHDYCQEPEKFRQFFAGDLPFRFEDRQAPYRGEPYFVSEYGGIKWDVDGVAEGWGYGDAPKSEEEFIERYRGLTETLLRDKRMLGFCYTQLYDVEQEVNGLMTYDRKFKFDPEIFREINAQKAAIEEE